MPRLDTESKEGWLEELEDFKCIVYPKIFEPFGFSFQEAWAAWQLNLLKNAIYELEEKIEDLNDKSW